MAYGWWRPVAVPANNFQHLPPQPLVDFKLRQATGQPFSLHQLLGRWSLVFSGYTHCPDVCPVTLSLIAQVDQARSAGLGELQLQLVFVSVDPTRDTPAELRRYLSYFSTKFIGVTGSETELNRLLIGLGFYPSAPVTDKNSGTGIAHSGAVAVVNPAGQVAGLLRAPLTVASITTQLQVLLQSG